MKRWNVTLEDGMEIKLYYPSLEEVTSKYPNCKISPCEDMSHMSYINKILSMSTLMRLDYKGRQIHTIPYNSAYILVRLSYDDKDAIYYDFLEYQRHDNTQLTQPITFTWSTPQEFHELFFYDTPEDKSFARFSDREFKKIKPKPTKFYNKNSDVYWFDDEGYIYYTYKGDLPNKRNKEEWSKFHDNHNAVFVWYTEPPYGNCKYEWFASIDEFYTFFDELKRNANLSLYYEVKRTGYKALHPQDRRNIFRMPYFNIDKEMRLAHALNTESKYDQLARTWAKLCTDKYFRNWYENIDFTKDIIKRYCEYKENNIV